MRRRIIDRHTARIGFLNGRDTIFLVEQLKKITERRRADEELVRSRLHYQTLVTGKMLTYVRKNGINGKRHV